MSDHQFTGKVAVITGAGTGIGFEIARSLAAAGAAVVINDLDAAAAAAAAESIRSSGGTCELHVGDASQLDQIQQLIQHATSSYGRLDIAVANAGISPFGSFLDFTVPDLKRLLEVNLQGSFLLAQQSARQMLLQLDSSDFADDGDTAEAASFGGRILLMSSVTGIQFHPSATAYGMTKAAIRMLVRNLGVELAAHKITVNAVAPGATLTERTQMDADYADVWSRITPSGAPATPGDIAAAALFLLSPAARQITGQTLVVDGGWTATSPRPY